MQDDNFYNIETGIEGHCHLRGKQGFTEPSNLLQDDSPSIAARTLSLAMQPMPRLPAQSSGSCVCVQSLLLSSFQAAAGGKGPPTQRRLRPVAQSDLRQPTAVPHSSSPSVNPSLLMSSMFNIPSSTIKELASTENALQCIVCNLMAVLHNYPKLAKLTLHNLYKSSASAKWFFCITVVIELHWLWCRIRNFKQFLLAATAQIWSSTITYGRRW